ncbi:hypothetical protein [Rathayibacter sp. AY1E2]|uniref:hypothetical protein n=1 Tax=Rathayibacter sp. AY1E2 TaxID=2080550 RepID=UPI000CE918EF|nr:hypothetical protein [Rathayibacter sp. AY1E2]PPH52622.1 hypothetical protein C5C49_08415 [Rathayibacter sp. AY1E2]
MGNGQQAALRAGDDHRDRRRLQQTGGGGSFAWVSEGGSFGAERAVSGSSFHAELIAIDEAIRAQPQFSRLRLLVDCRQALEAVTLVLA